MGSTADRRAGIGAVVVVLALLVGTLLGATPAAAADDPCGPSGNPVACENTKSGTPESDWDIYGAGDPSIQGFATDISVNRGQRVDFKIDTDARDYTIQIFRVGFYGGDGARLIDTIDPTASLPQVQPECFWDMSTELTDCGNWAVSASWTVPATAVSGVYFARLERSDDGGASHIMFVVRDDASHSDVVFQTSDTTWQAYNPYGGSDFYQGASNGRAYKISYNRPIMTRQGADQRSFFFSGEYPMVRFLEENGYDVSYIAGVDTDRSGGLLTNHKTFLSVGHDEYWSGTQVRNVTAARDAGVSLAFFSGNQMYWRTRWEASVAGTPVDFRTLVSYKETWSTAKIDPSGEWTGTFRDPRYASQQQGAGVPENSLSGTLYVSDVTDLPVTVTSGEGKLRFWRGTGLDQIPTGQSVALEKHTVGYESNEDQDNGFRPEGLFRLSTSSGSLPERMLDFGNTTGPGTTTHNMTLYRASSGALVFSAGSIQWAWGLDSHHDGAETTADPRMRQATVNLLADMSAQPLTPAGVTRATRSTDVTAPDVTITAPEANETLANGTEVTVTGGAADAGGGVVAAVEVSTDGGESWHPADGTTSWSYTYIQHGTATGTVAARAVDDSGNIGSPRSRAVRTSCPCSIYGDETPAVPSADDSSAAELGLRFTPQVDGFVSGVRFYKSSQNTGPHTGSLWSSTGELLGRATFDAETESGWQTVRFGEPVAVSAGQAYVVSYSTTTGHYAYKEWEYSLIGKDASPLSVAGGFAAPSAGTYGEPGTFPTQSYKDATYFVDVTFADSGEALPVLVSSRWPLSGAQQVPASTQVTATLSKPVQPTSVTLTLRDANGTAVPGSTTYDEPTRTVTFTPAADLADFVTFTATVAATGLDGTAVTGGAWSFQTARPPANIDDCPCSVFGDTETPEFLSLQDPALAVGTRFIPTTAGEVSALRFFKSQGSTVDHHTGSLWGPDGTLLASVTFDDETAFGWQTAPLDAPVALTAGQTYTVSYWAPDGWFAASLGAFAAPEDLGVLTTPANAGVYGYGDARPTSQMSSAYFADVVFAKASNRGSIVQVSPASGAVGVAAGSSVTVRFSEPVVSDTSVRLTDALGIDVPGAVSQDGTGSTLTFDPSADLAAGATYTVAVAATTTVSGKPVSGTTWTFVTAAAPTGTHSLYSTADTPQFPSLQDPALSVGTRFIPTADGGVEALRFFKAQGDPTTAHVGSLWGPTGALLASVTFGEESASGWQVAQLGRPIALTAGQTYTVSYWSPQGYFAATVGALAQPQVHGALTTPANAGVYTYGPGMPGNPMPSSYYVDVVFVVGTGTGTGPEPTACPCTYFTTETPTVASEASDRSPVSLGMAFSPTVDGWVSAIRFYKGASNTGVHTGALWTADGRRLAAVTFRDETELGWQTATLSEPVAVTADTRYVVSYFAPEGGYAYTYGLHTVATTHGNISVPADGGVYVYSAEGSFPAYTWAGSSYFVDVVLDTEQAVSVSSALPDAGATGVGLQSTVSAKLNAAPLTGTPQISLTSAAGDVAGTSSFETSSRTVTFTPEALSTLTEYTATLRLGDDVLRTWTFTTGDAPPTSWSLWSDADQPTVASWADTSAVQVGTRVRVTESGTVQAIRFYRGEANTGQHTGYVWRADGTKLGEGVFTDETGSGWQTLVLPDPVPVVAGTELVVSYYTPTGGYAVTPDGLAAERAIGPLSTVPQGGAYTDGTGFPGVRSTHNYWVDLVFAPGDVSAEPAPTPEPTPTPTPTPEPGVPQSLYLESDGPDLTSLQDLPLSVGTRFSPTVDGTAEALRFFKAEGDPTSSHVGSLWGPDGVLLASVTFVDESAAGWQTAQLDEPVTLVAGQTYTVSYWSPQGFFVATLGRLEQPTTRGALNTPAAAGVYTYGEGIPANAMPSAYYVDVVFVPGGVGQG